MSAALHRLSVALSGSNIELDSPSSDDSPVLDELLARPDPTSPFYYSNFSFGSASSARASPVSPGISETCPLEPTPDEAIPTSRRASDLQVVERRRSSTLVEKWERETSAHASPRGSVRERPGSVSMRKKPSHVSFSDDHIPPQRPSLASVNFSRPSRSSSTSSLAHDDARSADLRRNSSFVRGFDTLPFTVADDGDGIHPLDAEEAEQRRASEDRRRERDRRHASFQRGFTALPYDDDDDEAAEFLERPSGPVEEQKDNADRFAVMTAHLYTRSKNLEYFKSESLGGIGIVSIRVQRNEYRTYCDVNAVPVDERDELADHLDDWDQGISSLNPEVAIKITSNVVLAIMARLDPHALDVPIDAETRIQVVEKISHLGTARKHQFAAFVRQEGCLVFWSDEVATIVEAAEALEQRFVQYVWLSSKHKEEKRTSLRPTLVSVQTAVDSQASSTPDVEKLAYMNSPDVEGKSTSWDPSKQRPMRLYAPIITGAALAGNMAFIGLACKTLISEYGLDGKPLRFLLLLTSPLTFVVAFFFCLALISCCWSLIGPVAQYHENSRFYSGKAPPRRVKRRLPHMTVVMPVYKEGLEGVIMPTIDSLKECIMTYERQGGTASILICEDGMQLWDEETANIRKTYYDSRAIGWVARPKHGKDGFLRKGRFKKASNMNFAFAVSLRIEELMDEMRPTPNDSEKASGAWVWSAEDEDELYAEAMQLTIQESCGTAWAAGNVRIGEYILIIDSDTRVPTDCFLDAVNELDDHPEVAIIQHESDVMMVSTSYFEAGIAHFTRHINTAISFCCANGEVAPFVGHNAFMRWSAVQDSCFVDPDDGWTKMWSESHVSEDFDMSLRAQMRGYTVRWATYSKGGFKEGVSLTCDNELDRWQKYAYGCSELLFHPMKDWWRRGLLTPLVKTFIKSDIPLHSKLSVMAYVTSYWAIGCAVLTTTLNWILIGIWESALDDFYLESFKVFLTCIVVFSLFGNLTSAVFKYRLKVEGFGTALGNNLKWLGFFFIFFSGLSWHVAAALMAHLFSVDMQWGSTLKEVEASSFFREVPLILKRFWPAYCFAFTLIVGMIVMSLPVIPAAFQITSLTAILPTAVMAFAHVTYPLFLNPYLMLFSF